MSTMRDLLDTLESGGVVGGGGAMPAMEGPVLAMEDGGSVGAGDRSMQAQADKAWNLGDVGEAWRRRSEAQGDLADPGEGAMETGFRYLKSIAPGPTGAGRRLARAQGMTVESIPELSQMSEDDVAWHLNSMEGIRPPADWRAQAVAGLPSDWSEAKREMFARANWMSKTAADYESWRSGPDGPGLVAKVVSGAVDSLPLMGEIALGGIAKKGVTTAAKGAMPVARWALGKAAEVLPFAAMEGPTRYAELRAPQVAMDEGGVMPRAVAEGAGAKEAAQKAAAYSVLDPLVETAGGELAAKALGRGVNWATGGKAGQALEALGSLGYKVADKMPAVSVAMKRFYDAVGWNGFGTELLEEGLQSMTDAVGNLSNAYESAGFGNLQPAAQQFLQDLPEIAGSLALQSAGMRAAGIPSGIRQNTTVKRALASYRDAGYAIPDEAGVKAMDHTARIRLLNETRDLDAMRRFGPEGLGWHSMDVGQLSEMDPVERRATLEGMKDKWYAGRALDLGLDPDSAAALVEMDEDERRSALAELGMDSVLVSHGVDTSEMTGRQKRKALEEVVTRRVSEAAGMQSPGGTVEEQLTFLADVLRGRTSSSAMPEQAIPEARPWRAGAPAMAMQDAGAMAGPGGPGGPGGQGAASPLAMPGQGLDRRGRGDARVLEGLDGVGLERKDPWGFVAEVFQADPKTSITRALRAARLDENSLANRSRASRLRMESKKAPATPAQGTPGAAPAPVVDAGTLPAAANTGAQAPPATPGVTPGQADGLDGLDGAQAPGQAPAVTPGQVKLPKALAGAKPRFNVGSDSYEPEFEDDVDKALFIVAQETRSKSDGKYIEWLQGVFPGESESSLRGRGKSVRGRVKAAVKGQQAGVVRIPALGRSVDRVGVKTADAARAEMERIELEIERRWEELRKSGLSPDDAWAEVDRLGLTAQHDAAEAEFERLDRRPGFERLKDYYDRHPGSDVELALLHARVKDTPENRRVAERARSVVEGKSQPQKSAGAKEREPVEGRIMRVVRGLFGTTGRVVVLRGRDQVPASVRESLVSRSGMAWDKLVLHAFFHQGKVWFVASEMEKGAQRAGMELDAYIAAKALHEFGVHYGLRKMMGELYGANAKRELTALMKAVVSSVGRETILEALPGTYAKMSDEELGEEYLAYLAEKLDAGGLTEAEQTVWTQVLAFFKKLLTGKVRLSDDDLQKIVKMAVSRARAEGEDGNADRGTGNSESGKKQAKKQTSSDEGGAVTPVTPVTPVTAVTGAVPRKTRGVDGVDVVDGGEDDGDEAPVVKKKAPAKKAPAKKVNPAPATPQMQEAQPETDYRNGDKIAYTGVITEDGFREFVYLEGTKAGQRGVALTEEERDANVQRNRKEREEQQAGFARLNKRAKDEKGAGVVGNATTIVAPGMEAIGARYEVRELGDLTASHNARSGSIQPEAGYPAGLQERSYKEGSEEAAGVVEHAQAKEARFWLSDSATAADGPPTVTGDGMAINGNGRLMSLQYAAGNGDLGWYRDALLAKAESFGVDRKAIEGMKEPVLVRVVDMKAGSAEAAKFGRAGNKVTTTAKSAVRTAAALNRLVDSDLLESLDLESGTFSEAVSGPDGKAFRRMLRDAVGREDAATYLTADNDLTLAGKDLVQNLLLTKLLPVEVVERLGEERRSLKNALEGSILPLLRIRRDFPDADITPQLGEAVSFVSRNPEVRTSGEADVLLGQGNLLTGDVDQLVSPGARMLVDFLLKQGGHPRVFKTKIESFIRGLEDQSGLFGDQAEQDPVKVASDALGVKARENAEFGPSAVIADSIRFLDGELRADMDLFGNEIGEETFTRDLAPLQKPEQMALDVGETAAPVKDTPGQADLFTGGLVKKAAWQMTTDEFFVTLGVNRKRASGQKVRNVYALHKQLVDDAQARGENVPKSVLISMKWENPFGGEVMASMEDATPDTVEGHVARVLRVLGAEQGERVLRERYGEKVEGYIERATAEPARRAWEIIAAAEKKSDDLQASEDARIDVLLARGMSYEDTDADSELRQIQDARIAEDNKIRDAIDKAFLNVFASEGYDIDPDIQNVVRGEAFGATGSFNLEDVRDTISKALDERESTIQRLARWVFKKDAEAEGQDPDGLLGNMSGLTEMGKRQRVQSSRIKAERMLNALASELLPPQHVSPDQTKFSMEGGYDGFSMSNRARRAYAEGKKPASVLGRDLGVSAAAVRQFLSPTEWHHSSMYYNQTDFYELPDEDSDGNPVDRDALVARMKAWDKEQRDSKSKSPVVKYRAQVEWVEWSGTRNHPKANKHSEEADVEEKGDWYVISPVSGRAPFRKKKGANGLSVKRLDGDFRASVEQTETPAFKAWFGDSKVVDGNGKPLRVYHGTQRPDRVGTKFNPKRATSGPMSFFTDNPELASKYASGKADTSIEAPDRYAEWFRMRVPGRRGTLPIDRAWYALDSKERERIARVLPFVSHITDEGEETNTYAIRKEHGLASEDHWAYTIRAHRGDVLAAAVDLWLDGGVLFGSEGDFLDILEAAGIKGVEMDSPHQVRSGVIPVYLAIQNPLVTSEIPDEVAVALREAGKRKRASQNRTDNPWDKRARSGKDWLDALENDLKEGSTLAWTSIPDWVTQTLQGLGYDGIHDVGGKMGGETHNVWIPFRPNQVKSATGNRGTFDASKDDIRASVARDIEGFDAAAAQRTQRAGTAPTYVKAGRLLKELAGKVERVLDYGSGLGIGSKYLPGQVDQMEPYAKGYAPKYVSGADVPSDFYDGVVSLNVLNVLPDDFRRDAIYHIGRVLKPGGVGLIMVRHERDIRGVKTGRKLDSDVEVLTGTGTYQKGFTSASLSAEMRDVLGDGFEVEDAKDRLGNPTVILRKTKPSGGGGGGGVRASMEQVKEDEVDGLLAEGWFIHGRADSNSLRDDVVIQMTKDHGVAESFAGKRGSKWMVRPANGAVVLDLSDEDSDDMDDVVEKAVAAFNEGRLPFIGDVEGGLGKDRGDIGDDELEEVVRREFAPVDLVDSAGAFDNQAWVNWLVDATGADFVYTPGDTAVAISREIEARRVGGEGVRASMEQTGTPEFKAWFGDSKIVNSDGSPRVLYHGTTNPKGIRNFNRINGMAGHFGSAAAANDRAMYTQQGGDAKRGSVLPVYVRMENPVRMTDVHFDESITMADDLVARKVISQEEAASTGADYNLSRKDEARAIAAIVDLLERKGYDGIVYGNRVESPGEDSYIPFHPEQIKSAIGNSGAFDANSSNIRFSAEGRNLVAVHNLNEQKLGHALRMGGFAVPSVAVVGAESGYERFGDITLVGDKGLVDPKQGSVKAYGADVYSQRYPTVYRSLKREDERKIDAAYAELRAQYPVGPSYIYVGDDLDTDNTPWYLMWAHAEGLIEPDTGLTRAAMDSQLRDLRYKQGDRFKTWVDRFLREQGIEPVERIVAGYTRTGNRKYLPHTLETAVRLMKGDPRAKESTHGVGRVRAVVTPQFSSVSAMKRERGRLVSYEEMQAIIKEVNDEFFELAEWAKGERNHTPDNPFMFYDDFQEDLIDFARKGAGSLREWYKPGTDFTPLRTYLDKLRTLPTEYFEVKIQRAVGLEEFRAAVVPDTLSPDLVGALRSKGVHVVMYKEGDTDARKATLQQVTEAGDLRFSVEQEATPAFKAWFGDSKIVDDDGRPLRVYHGTGSTFTRFDNGNAKTGLDRNRRGVPWFSSSPVVASMFAGEQAGDNVAGMTLGNSQVYPVFLRIENPYIDESGEYAVYGGLSAETANKLKAQGYDGIIWPESRSDLPESPDGYSREYDGKVFGEDIPYPTQYAVFSPSQIKSAIGNSGAFDPENPDIRASFETAYESAKAWAGEKLWAAGAKMDPKGSAALRRQLAAGDTNEKVDLTWWDSLVGTPQRYMKKIPALSKLWDAAQMRRRVRHEITQALFGVNERAGRDDLKAITSFERAHRGEYRAKWAPYIVRRDRDAVGYFVRLRDGMHEVVSPTGVVVQRLKEESAAWMAAYMSERADVLAGRDFVRTEEGIRAVTAKTGWSQDAADALLAFRLINDRTWQHLYDLAQKAKKEYQEAGEEAPRVEVDGEEISIFEAMRQMGDRRGYYMPRLRKGGRHILYAKKDGENPRLETFDTAAGRLVRAVALEKDGWDVEKALSARPSEEAFLDASAAALNDLMQHGLQEIEKHQRELTAKDFQDLGFATEVVKYKKKDGTTEEHFIIQGFDRRWNELWKSFGGHYYDDKQNGLGEVWHFVAPDGGVTAVKRALLRAIVNEQMARMGTIDLFGRAIAQQLAVMLQSRGSRARKISRRGDVGQDVWTGYEEDPLKAVTQATMSVAGGTAKSQMAKTMLNAVMGIEEPWREFLAKRLPKNFKTLAGDEQRMIRHELWEEYEAGNQARRIDSGLQPEAFRDAGSFIKEVMRNEEPMERIFGTIKGVAALKYLTGIAPGVVNLTSLGTTVPAVFHHEAKIPFGRSLALIAQMSGRYAKHRWSQWKGSPSGLSAEDAWLFGEIANRGWDDALMNVEAMSVMKGQLGGKWRRMVDVAMMGFTLTEKLNRAATIAAGYYGLKEQLKGAVTKEQRDELLEKAKKLADGAHATYGKENLPQWMRGAGMGQQALRSAYMYRTYSHNLLQMMVEMGVGSKKDHKALGYLLVSLPVHAGPKAFVAAPAVWALAKIVIAVFGGTPPDDPEEAYYEWVRDTFGTYAEYGARGGVLGLAGIDVSGSVSMQGLEDVPATLREFLVDPEKAGEKLNSGLGNAIVGPAGQMVFGYGAGGVADLARGRIVRAAEKLAPRLISSPIRAAREYLRGVETAGGAPVFYGDERMRPSVMAAVLRALSFNPMEVSAKRTEQYSERQVKAKYDAVRSGIYERIDRWAGSEGRTAEGWVEILADVEEYNRTVRLKAAGAPIIQGSTIKARLKRMVTAPKSERERGDEPDMEMPELPDFYEADDALTEDLEE